MKIKLLLFLSLVLPLLLKAEQDFIIQGNFSSFSRRAHSLSDEFKKDPMSGYLNHPDAGFLPFRRPPIANCYELLTKRNSNSRFFIVDGSKGRHFIQQTSEAAINYLDSNGYWMEINPRLKPSANGKEFYADEQPTPLSINVADGSIRLVNKSHFIKIAKHVKLFHRLNGMNTPLSNDQSFIYTAGDDGVRFSDKSTGIDLVYKTFQGKFEYSFVLNKKLPFTSGEIVMEADVEFSNGLFLRNSIDGLNDFTFFDENDSQIFTVSKAFGYDSDRFRIPLNSIFKNGTIVISIPVSVLSRPEILFPFVIDPTVTATNTLPLSSITGSGFGASCFTGGCNYSLAVPSPANATLTNVYFSFEYLAVNGLCNAEDGAFKIDFNGCTAPSAAPGVFTCAFPFSNFYCSYSNEPLPEFISCLPAPSCSSQVLNFDLTFFRCTNDPLAGCSNACIAASQPWIITVEGETLDLASISPSSSICSGDAVLLQAISRYGVPPYSYSWTIGATSDTVTVFPVSTTTYSVTVSDACGNTVQGSSTVNVAANTNPGFTISPASPCQGIPVTISANGSAPVADYDWTIPGAGLPGNLLNDNIAPVVSYSLAGTFSITLNFSSAGCVFDSTLYLTVSAPVIPDVVISSSLATAVCAGDPITFTASPTNGGSTPFYTWLVNGSAVQSGVPSFTSSFLNNGDLVQLIMTSSLSCVDPVFDTASTFAPVNLPVTPTVSITNTSGLCEGDTLTFTATETNGGIPSFQWLVNGSPEASGAVFSSSTLVNGDVVSVILTSSLSCVSSSTATSQLTVSLLPRVIPDVFISASPSDTICAGQQVTLTAGLVGSGISAAYQWLVNSVNTGFTGDEFISSVLQNGDVVQAIATANGQCLSVNIDTSNFIRIISRAALDVNISQSAPVCKGDQVSVQAIASGGAGTYYYNWNISSIDSSAISFTAESTREIMVAVSDNCSPQPGLDTLILSVLPGSVADFSYSNPAPGSFKNEVEFTNTSENAISYQWIFFDVTDTAYSNDENPVHQFEEEGEYDVLLITQSPSGCLDSVRYKVLVKEQLAVYVPNAFTPDGDLKNDEFGPIGSSVKTFDLTIFSRWGQKLFQGTDKTWNGTVNGRMVENGVYLYRIETAGEVLVGRVAVIR